MAIDAGDDKLATKNLADMIRDTEPERAIGLYERAIEAGNTSAYTALAFMIQTRYPDRAMWLCRKAIEGGRSSTARICSDGS